MKKILIIGKRGFIGNSLSKYLNKFYKVKQISFKDLNKFKSIINNFDYIVNISEDGWFGNSVGPKQHFSHSIFRSIETGKYIIRSANNGISAIINPMGSIEQKVEFGLTGYIDFVERKLIKPTSFMLYGNKIFLILILIYIFLIFSFNRLKNE